MSESLNKFKIYSTSSSLTFPVVNIKLLLLVEKKKKQMKLTAKTLGFELGETSPFLLYNIKLADVFKDDWISKITDEVLLSAVVILNKKWKNPTPAPLKDVANMPELKEYASTSHLFTKNELFEFYISNLKKLVFFQESLFSEVLLLKDRIVSNTETADLIRMNDLIAENIKWLESILFDKLTIQDSKIIKGPQSEVNFFQPSFAVNIVSSDKLSEFNANFATSLTGFATQPLHGLFFVLIKSVGSKETDKIAGQFNVFVECTSAATTGLLSSKEFSAACTSRTKTMKDLFGALVKVGNAGNTANVGKVGGRKTSRTRQRSRPRRRSRPLLRILRKKSRGRKTSRRKTRGRRSRIRGRRTRRFTYSS
jgi:hypothetical protein